jgi:hypothetical protein
MTATVLEGIGLTMVAGIMSGNCRLPSKFARKWKGGESVVRFQRSIGVFIRTDRSFILINQASSRVILLAGFSTARQTFVAEPV